MKKLDKRKELASRVLKVGKNKIKFDESNLDKIKEAITKQDIKDLYAEGIIEIKEKRGRKKIKKRKTRKGPGKMKKKIKKRKEIYVKSVRKLRKHIKEEKQRNRMDNETYRTIRKKIKARVFRDKSHLKEYIAGGNKK